MFLPQNVCMGSYLMLRIADQKRGSRNPSAPIGVNAFRTTNIRSQSAMRGADFHGNTCRDGPTRIPSIRTERGSVWRVSEWGTLYQSIP